MNTPTACEPISNLLDPAALVQDIKANRFDDPDGIETTTVWITPRLAGRWLERNIVNRPVAKGSVDALKWDLTHAKWKLTHQGIAFSREGSLIDGQHRLHAIVESKTAALLRVSWNVEGEYAAPIDTGYIRRVAHIVGISPMHVAVCNVLVLLTLGNCSRVSASQVRVTYDRFRAEIDWAIKLAGGHPLTAPLIASFAFAYPANPEKVSFFAEQFVMYQSDGPTSPVVALRRLLERPAAVRSMGRRGFALATLRCIQAFVEDEALQRVVPSENAYEFFKARRPDAA
jgi:hypothetical protein